MTDDFQTLPQEGRQRHGAHRHDEDHEHGDRISGREEDAPLRGVDRFDLRQEEQRDPEGAERRQQQRRRRRGSRESDVPGIEEMRHDGPVGEADHGDRSLLGNEVRERREEAPQLAYLFRFCTAEPIHRAGTVFGLRRGTPGPRRCPLMDTKRRRRARDPRASLADPNPGNSSESLNNAHTRPRANDRG